MVGQSITHILFAHIWKGPTLTFLSFSFCQTLLFVCLFVSSIKGEKKKGKSFCCIKHTYIHKTMHHKLAAIFCFFFFFFFSLSLFRSFTPLQQALQQSSAPLANAGFCGLLALLRWMMILHQTKKKELAIIGDSSANCSCTGHTPRWCKPQSSAQKKRKKERKKEGRECECETND